MLGEGFGNKNLIYNPDILLLHWCPRPRELTEQVHSCGGSAVLQLQMLPDHLIDSHPNSRLPKRRARSEFKSGFLQKASEMEMVGGILQMSERGMFKGTRLVL